MSLLWPSKLPCTRKMTWLLRQSAIFLCSMGSFAATHSESCTSPGLWRQGWICGLTRIRKSSSTASEHLAHIGHLSIWASASNWQGRMYRLSKSEALLVDVRASRWGSCWSYLEDVIVHFFLSPFLPLFLSPSLSFLLPISLSFSSFLSVFFSLSFFNGNFISFLIKLSNKNTGTLPYGSIYSLPSM